MNVPGVSKAFQKVPNSRREGHKSSGWTRTTPGGPREGAAGGLLRARCNPAACRVGLGDSWVWGGEEGSDGGRHCTTSPWQAPASRNPSSAEEKVKQTLVAVTTHAAPWPEHLCSTHSSGRSSRHGPQRSQSTRLHRDVLVKVTNSQGVAASDGEPAVGI